MLTNFFVLSKITNLRQQFSNGPQGALTITVEVIISFLTPKGLLKTQLFEKKKQTLR